MLNVRLLTTAEAIAVDLTPPKNTYGIKQEQLNCINCSVVTCFSSLYYLLALLMLIH